MAFPFSPVSTQTWLAMNAIISYDTIVGLLANPPCLDPCPNFFNLCALQTHFARALKKVPCPQSAVNGWAVAVLASAMYALINTTAFHWNISPQSTVPIFPEHFVTQADGTQELCFHTLARKF